MYVLEIPNTKKKGAPGSKPGISTSIGNSDDPISLGDGLNFPKLTERVTKLESSLEEIKEMIKTLVENSRSPSTDADVAKEIWVYAQMYLQIQKQVGEEKQNMHMELVRIMVDAKYKETQEEVKSIKDFILENTGTTLILPKYHDDTKKGKEE
ncbi:hypothetical protein Hanom_Chr02g00115001 [Helianthus anomalus]